MAVPMLSPNRVRNSRVSFDLEEFIRRLIRAHGRTPEDLPADFTKHPSGWFSAVPGWGSGTSDKSVDYLFAELLSKYDDKKSVVDLDEVAFAKFHDAEEACLHTNLRFAFNEFHRFSFGVTAGSVLYIAQRKIANVLGEFSWDEAEEGFGWGPGATVLLSRDHSDPTYKFQAPLETTAANLPLALTCLDFYSLWRTEVGADPLEIVEGNKVITVPKNAKTNRVIAIEPRMNMFVQKGLGRMIRRRLYSVGIDIDSQEYNRSMAQLGSKYGNLATIDLSAASDTVSYALVESLLPEPWFLALEQCRSDQGTLPSGEKINYQKFSSMGNGYTFELETLLFWALSSAVIEVLELKDRRVSVFGDDIIVPTDCAIPLTEVFHYCGFTANLKKTFIEGSFRESCGGHYFGGNDVTPFYIRRKVDRLTELFLLHNNLYRYMCRTAGRGLWIPSEMTGLIRWLRSKAPYNWRRPRISDGYGDGAFIGTFDETCPQRAPRGYEGWTANVLVERAKDVPIETYGLLLKSLFKLERQASPSGNARASTYPSVGRGYGITKMLMPRYATQNPYLGFVS